MDDVVERVPVGARVTLLVLYTTRLEDCLRFYRGLGLSFTAERHGGGPEHYAAVLAGDGVVIELYPAREGWAGRGTEALRLGLAVEGAAATPVLAVGRHTFADPDGRTVVVDAG